MPILSHRPIIRHLLLIAVMVYCAISPQRSAAADFTTVHGTMYRDRAFHHPANAFSPFDPVYILINFENIKPGTYNLMTDWKTPWGSLEHQSIHSFVITAPTSSYKVFSWLRLWKNGPFKRAVTGDEYKKEFYGMWEVILYLNGDQITKQHFEIR